MKAELDWFVNF